MLWHDVTFRGFDSCMEQIFLWPTGSCSGFWLLERRKKKICTFATLNCQIPHGPCTRFVIIARTGDQRLKFNIDE